MHIGIIQMNSQPDKGHNLAVAEKMIDTLADSGAELIVLPEYFNFYGHRKLWWDAGEKLDDSPSLERIRARAVRHGVAIHCGSFLERSGDTTYNTGVVFDREGERLAVYRKIHLYDVTVPGGIQYHESAVLAAGREKPPVFRLQGIDFGMATCYDIRFPELFRSLAERGAEVFLLPAAFTMNTGKDHWELLLRARAVENLSYVVAAGQYGTCHQGLVSYGRSMVVDPWGLVLEQAEDMETTLQATLDVTYLREMRSTFPVLMHRRNDIFKG